MNRFLNRTLALCSMAACFVVADRAHVSAQPPLPSGGAQSLFDNQPAQTQMPQPMTMATQPASNDRQLFRTALGTSPYSGTRQRLTRAPDMFGDSLLPGPGLLLSEPGMTTPFRLIQPGGGGFKISDNGEVLPTDRVWLNYNFFNNGLGIQSRTAATNENYSHYNIGLEKTLCDGAFSYEIRVPINDFPQSRLDRSNAGPLFLRGGSMGNTTVVSKSLLYQDARTSVGGGFGLEIPTGDDIYVFTPTEGAFQVDNQAFLLHPFIGMNHVDDDDSFYYGFVQFTIPLSSHDVYQFQNFVPSFLGQVDPLTLVHLDFGIGKWIYRSDSDRGLTGIAPIFEMHYISTLEKVQFFSNSYPTPVYTEWDSFHSLNFTGGVHFEINGYSVLRLAAVLPALGRDFRTFDSEIQAMYTILY